MGTSYQRFCDQCKRPRLAIYLPVELGAIGSYYTCGDCIEELQHQAQGAVWKALVTKRHQLKRFAARAA